MNKYVLLFCIFLLASAGILVMNRKEAPKRTWPGFSPVPGLALTEVKWIDSTLHLGKRKEGDSIPLVFRFKNAGEHRLIVSGVAASCGCTLPEKPEKPIEAGAEGFIRAFFKTKGNKGHHHKMVMVYMNTKQGTYNLPFDVEVLAE